MPLETSRLSATKGAPTASTKVKRPGCNLSTATSPMPPTFSLPSSGLAIASAGRCVAAPQPWQHFRSAGRRLVDMRHQRQADLVGGFEREVDRGDAAGAASVAARANLDADDDIGVLAHCRHGFARLAEPQVAAFADRHRLGEAEDAGKGDVDASEDADFRALDDMASKAQEIAGAGAAGVDEGGGAALGGEPVGIDAERGAAPVDMAVQVDEAGGDDAIPCVDDLPGGLGIDCRVDRGDAAI